MLDITLIGTGALHPLPDRALTAAALSCCGRSVLLDCGEGTQSAARAAGVGFLDIDMIALTHYHGDHTLGLPGLLLTMNIQGRTSPLVLTGPRGLKEAMAPILALVGWVGYPILLETLPEDGLRLRDRFPGWPPLARLTPFPTQHVVPSQGYVFELGRAGRFDVERARALHVPQPLWGRLQAGERVAVEGRQVEPGEVLGPPRKGLKVAFSGDTRPCPALVEAARNADLMICEATFADDSQREAVNRHGHTLFSQAGEMAARAGAKRLWLCHFSQMVEDPAACLPLAQAAFPGAQAGEDGMRLTLNFGD